jgi:1,4-dihydroxy-6-naphthoate synthase
MRGQLTYQNEGLEVCADFGIWWGEKNDGLPLPLGGNVVHKAFSAGDAANHRGRLVKASIAYSLEHRPAAVEHALQYARDMGRDLGGSVRGHVCEPLDPRLRRTRT